MCVVLISDLRSVCLDDLENACKKMLLTIPNIRHQDQFSFFSSPGLRLMGSATHSPPTFNKVT